MQLTKEDIEYIAKSKARGYSSRSIASLLGCSKSAVNYAYQRWLEKRKQTGREWLTKFKNQSGILQESEDGINFHNVSPEDRWAIQDTDDKIQQAVRKTIQEIKSNLKEYGTEYHPDDVAFKSKPAPDDLQAEIDASIQLIFAPNRSVLEFGQERLANTLTGNWKKQPKILFLDIESSPDIAVTFKRFKANFSQDNIILDGGWLLSIAWAWNNEPVTGLVLTENQAATANDRVLVHLLYNLIEEADIVVAQNGDRFDLPLIKARSVIHGLPAIKRVKTVDTLKIAKSMKFQSNRLDSLGLVLGVGRKVEHQGIKLWVECMQGNEEALQNMLDYNKQDVELLRDVYHKLKAWDNQAPNAGLYVDSTEAVCRVCGGEDVRATANQVQSGSSLYSEVICNDCGARSRLRVANTTKEKRKNLLA